MDIDELYVKNKLISIYVTKNLIICPQNKPFFNKYVKELTNNFSNIHTDCYNKNNLSIIEIANKKIKNSIFVNSESIKSFINEIKEMNIPESIIKQYSLTFLNYKKRLIKKEKWRKVIFTNISENPKKKVLKKIIIDNNSKNNNNISYYFNNRENIFKISKMRTGKNKEEKKLSIFNMTNKSVSNFNNNNLLLRKKRNLNNDTEKNNQLNSSSLSINMEDNAFQYNPSLFTTSPSLLNNNSNSEEIFNINKKNKSSNLKEKTYKKRGVFSTLKDVSRETLFFLIQKPETTIEEITKYIFNRLNLKTVHGKVQTYNNIQRRVYDTINVLQGLNKIEKNGFLQIHYILSEKEKKELVIINKQKELIVKLYLLYMFKLKNKDINFNLEKFLNNNNFIINKEQYLIGNDLLEKIKQKIIDISKDISLDCSEYLNNKIIDKFKIYLLNYDNNNMSDFNILENYKNISNDNVNEEDIINGNNINTTGSKVNTNDCSINQQKEENLFYNNNNDIRQGENVINNNDNSNTNNISLMNINKFQNLQEIGLNNNPLDLNNLNFMGNNPLNNNNFFYTNNFISEY